MTDDVPAPEQTAASTDAQRAQFAMQRIYVKDMSFESPMPITQRSQNKPAVSQDLHTLVSKLADNVFEVVLHLTITVKQDDKVAFLVEVHQAGLFHASGFEEPQLQQLLSSTCPSILFPYAREAIDNMATRGGFPPLMLPPINFDAVYAKAMADAKAREGAEGGSAGEMH